MSKIRFIRKAGRIIPIKGKDKILKSISDKTESRKYMKKGFQDMLEKDIPNSGRIVHEKANIKMIANFMNIRQPEKFNRAAKRIKDFLRENRKTKSITKEFR